VFGKTNQETIEAKAAPLARDLQDQYGAGAAEVARAALTSPGLSGQRKRVIRHALLMLDGSLPKASEAALGESR